MPPRQPHEQPKSRVVLVYRPYAECLPEQRRAWDWLWRRLLASLVRPAAASQEESPGLADELSDEAQTQQSP